MFPSGLLLLLQLAWADTVGVTLGAGLLMHPLKSTSFVIGAGIDLPATVDRLHDLMIGVEPDLTLLFDLDPAKGLARAVARLGKELRFEDMGLAFQERARAGFLGLAALNDRFRVIDADADPETVAGRVMAAVGPHLPRP